MTYRRLLSSKTLIFVPLTLLLIVAVACAEEATPQPTATPAPTIDTAALAALVAEQVKAGIQPAEVVSAAEIQQMVETAIKGIPEPPEAVSATEIQQMVETAVAEAAAAGASPVEIGELVSAAVAAAAEDAVTKEDVASAIAAAVGKTLTAQDISNLVKAVLPTPTPMPTPTPTPTFFTSTKVDRLLVSTVPIVNESNIPWKILGGTDMQAVRPWAEALLDTDPVTGKYIPRLAKAWETSADGRQWTITLEEGVSFHKGWGTFTGEDIRHNWLRVTSEESTAADATLFKGLINNPNDDIEVENDYLVRFNLAKVEPDMDQHMSLPTSSIFVQTSKVQWEAGGEAVLEIGAAGTGPFEFVKRELGRNVLYKRVENHWRKTSEFKELMIQFVREDATRLAMALTGETHMTTLPRDVQDQAVARGGWQRTVAAIPPSGVVYNLGGQYYSLPDKLDAENPFLDIRVREAMARAINVEEIIDTVFEGRAQRAVSQWYHPSQQGWDPSWPALVEELYGYNPDRSKELLTEAGYSDGFKVKIHSIAWPFFPEMSVLDQTVAGYWREIGIDTELVAMDFGILTPLMRGYDMTGRVQPWPGFGAKPPVHGSKLSWDSRKGGIFLTYGHPYHDERYDLLDQTVNRAERERLQREQGQHIIENYATIPILHAPSVLVFDPDIVEDYVVHGLAGGTFVNIADTRAVR